MTDLHRLIHASAHATGLPDASVQCIVTSPPYWALRKYSGEQSIEWPAVDYAPMPGLPALHVDAMRCELGLEPTPEAYIGHMVLCLREWRRVLREDGVAFVNLGDSYANSTAAGNKVFGNPDFNGTRPSRAATLTASKVIPSGLKPKDMVGIPWRFAFAVQADGWWLRSDIIWAKPNPMPESVRDRPTKAHEYIFLLTKSARYYWDADAVRESLQESSVKRWQNPNFGESDKRDGDDRHPERQRSAMLRGVLDMPAGRNVRDVWTMATQPTPYAHFATYPEALAEKCILAGTSARGACPTCGAPWRRGVEREYDGNGITWEERKAVGEGMRRGECHNRPLAEGGPLAVPVVAPTGWQPTCTCFGEFADSAILRPCVVLDPFHGSGTTGVVALRLGRAYVGVDISEEYLHGVTAERMGDGVQMGMAI